MTRRHLGRPGTCREQPDDRGEERGVAAVGAQQRRDRYRDQRAEGARRDRRQSAAEAQRDKMRRMAEQEMPRRAGGVHTAK
jgi:hypothetical protein